MQTNQQSLHMVSQPKVPLQQTQQSAPNLVPTQGQTSQHPQQQQQHLMSQMQSPSTQLQEQLGLQQQPNQSQLNMRQRLQASVQASSSLFQSQNLMDQGKQLYQSQRVVPEISSTSLDSTARTGHANGGDWQEEVYQKESGFRERLLEYVGIHLLTGAIKQKNKELRINLCGHCLKDSFGLIKTMKETYLPEINEMYQKIAVKLQQLDSLPQQPKSEQVEKLRNFKISLERIVAFLSVSKASIVPGLKDKLSSFEKQIVNCVNANRPRNPVSLLQQGQLPSSHMHSMQQSQPQVNQTQSHDNQVNPQLQSINLQGSVPTMQSNNMTSLQHNSLSSLPGVSTAQQTMLNSLQPGSSMDSGQGNTLGSMQQVAPESSQQNPVSTSQQANFNSVSSQSGLGVLKQNMNTLQSNSNMLQQQQEQQQMLHSEKHKQQFQQRQMQQQYMQQKRLLLQQQQQPLHQEAKQQLPTQLQTHQMPQLHQMNDINDIRQGMGVVKPGVYQHLPAAQHQSYTHQQLKPGGQFPISSPQLLQAASPQMPQHSSPQVDQQSQVMSISKTGTPLQSANSPFIVPSPSTPLAPSPMPGEPEKPVRGTSSLSNAANVGCQQGTSVQAGSQSLAISTPRISASPLLAEFTGADGTHASALPTDSSKSNIIEHPLERLMKAVKSMSPIALGASVSDIGSVVSMSDKIAGSAPGNLQLSLMQLQHQRMQQKIQQGNLQPSLMQSNMLQQQEQLHLHLTQLKSSQQSMQAMQSIPLPSLQQNQQSSLQQSTQTMLQKHQRSVLRQQQQPQRSGSAGTYIKQTPITQQAMMPQQTGHAIGDDFQEETYEKTPSLPFTSTLLTPSPTPGNFEKPIYSAKQANDKQAGSGCPVPESVSNGMSARPFLAESKSANYTYGNALKTDFGKSNVAEQPHYPRVTMAKPMSLESFSTSVTTMVDEAAAAVGEDFASMRKHGLHARNFFTQTGLTGAKKAKFYLSAIVSLALIFWCILFINNQY